MILEAQIPLGYPATVIKMLPRRDALQTRWGLRTKASQAF